MADIPEQAEDGKTANPQAETQEAGIHQTESMVTGPSQQPKKQHLRTLGTRLLAGILLIACVAVALLPQWIISANGVRRLIIRSIPNLQGDISVGSASIGWYQPLSIRDIELHSPDSTSIPVRIGNIKGTQGLLEIIRRGGRLGLITVNDTEINLTYDENHISNLQETIGKATVTKQLINQSENLIPSLPQPTGTTDERVRISVQDARVQINGPWTKTPWKSTAIEVEAVLNQYNDGTKEWSLTPVKILDHAQLNPSVAAGVLAYAAPILANTTRASGEFSLVINEARWINGQTKTATIDGNLTLHAVDVGPGPMVAKIIEALPGELPIPPTIRLAESSEVHFRKSGRYIRHEGLAFGIPLKASANRLDITSEGTVGIDDRSIDLTLSLPIPDSLPTDRPLFAALAGKSIKVSVEGTLDDPQLKLDASLKRTAAEVATDFVRELNNKRSQKNLDAAASENSATQEQIPSSPSRDASMKNPESQKDTKEKEGNAKKLDQLKGLLPTEISDDPTTDAVIDAVGGLLDEVAKRRAEREQMKSKENPEKPQQDRPARRFLRKILDAVDDETPDNTADKSN